jgi:hypothetical protein
MGWLSNIFKEPGETEEPSHSTGFHDLDARPVPMKAQGTDLRAARELVHTTAVKTAQMYGVPAHWLSFEVVTIADEAQAYFQLQVMQNHWDEYLAAHSYAFERAVLKRIREEDIDVGRAVRAVLWRTSPDAGCPYDDMPEPSAWTQEEIVHRGLQRDRINRALYAVTTPASGAVAMLPISSEGAARADSATLSDGDTHVPTEGFEDTNPGDATGFETTHSLSTDKR